MADPNSFKVNGTLLSLQPSEHGWQPRQAYGTDGQGHQIYPVNRQYQLRWSLSSPSDFTELVNFFNTVSVTGTVSVDLPEWGSSTYQFRTYSGCVLNEIEYSGYFENFYSEASLLIVRIRT